MNDFERVVRETEHALDGVQVTTPRLFLKQEQELLAQNEAKYGSEYHERDEGLMYGMYQFLLNCGIGLDDEIIWISAEIPTEGWAIEWGDECLIAYKNGERFGRYQWSARGHHWYGDEVWE